MAANKNWPRWVFASFTTWFDAHRDGVAMFIEGDDANTGPLSDYIEFRINGPTLEECSKDFWRMDAVVNILVVSKRNDVSTHTLYDTVGRVAAAFEKNIPIYRYGAGVDDDRTALLGCMILSDALEITHLGQVNPDIKEWQSMVQGHYRMHIEG